MASSQILERVKKEVEVQKNRDKEPTSHADNGHFDHSDHNDFNG